MIETLVLFAKIHFVFQANLLSNISAVHSDLHSCCRLHFELPFWKFDHYSLYLWKESMYYLACSKFYTILCPSWEFEKWREFRGSCCVWNAVCGYAVKRAVCFLSKKTPSAVKPLHVDSVLLKQFKFVSVVKGLSLCDQTVWLGAVLRGRCIICRGLCACWECLPWSRTTCLVCCHFKIDPDWLDICMKSCQQIQKYIEVIGSVLHLVVLWPHAGISKGVSFEMSWKMAAMICFTGDGTLVFQHHWVIKNIFSEICRCIILSVFELMFSCKFPYKSFAWQVC